MVRRWILCGAAASLLATSAVAEPNWRAAGGPIFVVADSEAATPSGADELARVPEGRQPFDAAVGAAAERHGLDPKLLHALVAVESAYRPHALSPAGAGGLTQLMPQTARELGVADRFDPAANLSAGADYLARQLVRFGDLRLALAAYNAGPARVARSGRIPRIAETELYVRSVLDCYLALAAGRAVRSSGDCRSAEQ